MKGPSRRMAPARLLLAVSAALFPVWLAACSSPTANTPRRVEYTETVRVDPGGKSLRLWMPIPRSTPHQGVALVEVRSPLKPRRTVDAEFGNEILYFESGSSGPVAITATYKIARSERNSQGPGGALDARDRRLYTSARGLVTIDDEVRRIAAAAAKGARNPVRVASRLFAAVLERMVYDKSVPGWGRGDTRRACVVGKGNCTDFHSLFLSLARTRGLPSRFVMGLPLKNRPEQSLGRSYHCWAEFHTVGRGWVPVDLSQAWKHPYRRGYFFGHLDRDRIALSVGREILLEPPQAGPRLNYFAYPHVEVGGKPLLIYDLERMVREAPADPGAASRAARDTRPKGEPT